MTKNIIKDKSCFYSSGRYIYSSDNKCVKGITISVVPNSKAFTANMPSRKSGLVKLSSYSILSVFTMDKYMLDKRELLSKECTL